MKRVLKILGLLLLLACVSGVSFAVYVQVAYKVDFPDTPLPMIAARTDAATIARGEYLVHAVAHCSICHGPAELVERHSVDFTQPLVGGRVWDFGSFGTFTARNITPDPTGIGAMSDGEIARAIRHGVDERGKLSPMMRLGVGPMSDEDLTAIVSWLRAQPPVEVKRPYYKLGSIGKFIALDFKPRLDAPPAHVPEGEISVARGKYLAEGPANCAGCHTPADPMNGFARAGALFSGETEPQEDPTNPAQEIIAPNLTPDPDTGHITSWSEDAFVARLRAGRFVQGSIMPWEAFARLTENDVRSLYRYLRTVPPVKRHVGPPVRPR